ncbi:MAG: hypothetical protein L0H29_10735 [Sinobacteraceae bacterium]|nr:hypothetical protein [Nevskiaceae bacterium]
MWNFVRQLAVPIVIVVALLGGGLAGAWGLPRLVILLAPHAPKLVVYGSSVVGILAGCIAGLVLAELAIRGLNMLSNGALHR